MQRIIFILVLFLLIPDVYIYFMHIIHTKKRWLRYLYWCPTILIIIGYTYYMGKSGDNMLANHAQGIGRLAIATMLFAVPKIIIMICSLIGISVHAVFHRFPRNIPTYIGLGIAVLCFAGILYGSTAGIKHFQIKNIEYHSERLPKGFDGYRIVQISDIHIGSWEGDTPSIKRLVELVNQQNADLIVFTGDLVNQRSCELTHFSDILSQMHAPDGIYSILGNHDYGSYYHWESPQAEKANLTNLINMEKNMGWRLLNNEHTILHHNGDSIALIGVENDGEPPFSQYADLPRAMKGTEGLFQILLSHNPTHWRREVLPMSDIDLMLAGHTHAMQIELFGHSLASLKYPEWSGMYYEGKRGLYVNIGIGYVGLPFRFGAWPEITVLTLHE